MAVIHGTHSLSGAQPREACVHATPAISRTNLNSSSLLSEVSHG
jgi:hypothetical protein